MKLFFWPTLIGLVTAMLFACAYEGSDHPVARKFTWFSYLSGDDIRASCVSGGPDRIRLVYNAIYTEQVRSYDISPAAESGRYEMVSRISRAADLSSFTTNLGEPDLFKPWRPVNSTTSLRPEDLVRLKNALQEDGFFEPTRVGLELPSHNFYWIGAACVGGQFHFNAFLWPDDAIEKMTFAKMVYSLDISDVPVSEPKNATLFDIYGTFYPDENQNIFTIKVAGQGLWRLGGNP